MVCFFFKYTATTEIYTYLHTLSLHDALPIYGDLHNEGGDLLQRLLHADRGDIHEAVGDGDLQGVFGLGIGLHRGDMALRRLLQQARREDHHAVDGKVGPVDLAQVGDGHLDVAPQDVDGQLVAGADTQRAADLVVQRNQRGAVIVGRPPFAGRDLVDRARLAHPGEAAVAAEHPLHVARNLELAGRHAVHGGDAPAQHGDLLQLADAGEALHQRIEVLDLVRLDVDEVEARRFLRQALADLAR